MSANNPEHLLDLAVLDDGLGPARCIGRAEAEALVQSALHQARIPAIGLHRRSERDPLAPEQLLRTRVPAIGLRPRARPPQRRLGVGRAGLLGVGILAASTAAAAFGTSAGRGWLARWTGTEAGTSADRPAAPIATTRHMPRPLAQSSVDGASEPARDVPVGSDPVEPAPAAKRSTASSGNPVEPAPAARRSTASVRQPQATPSDSQEAPADAEPSDEAVDLLALANDYRRQRRYRQALEMYHQVAERYPNSRQAEAARVAAAALKLEHLDDAEGAASEYRASAARRGQLGEEAAYGLAEAHRASGRRDLEKIQLERFVTSYPRSPLVTAARRRLAELEDDVRH